MFAPVSAAGPVGAGVGTHSALFQHVRQTRSDRVWPPLVPAGRQCRCQTGTVKVVTQRGDTPGPVTPPLFVNTLELLFSTCSVLPFPAITDRGHHCPVKSSPSSSPQAQLPSNGVISGSSALLQRCRRRKSVSSLIVAFHARGRAARSQNKSRGADTFSRNATINLRFESLRLVVLGRTMTWKTWRSFIPHPGRVARLGCQACGDCCLCMIVWLSV